MNLMLHRSSIAVLLIVAAAGCAGNKPRAATANAKVPVAPITNLDACAMRLHDISGALLMYYQKYHRLPEKLDELRQLPEFPDLPEFACPVSKQAYVYIPTGISSPQEGSRIVLHDATPAHDHHRWAVSITEPTTPGMPLVSKVIALPASGFRVTAR